MSAYDIAMRFQGMKEVPGTASHPLILGMLRLDDAWPQGDAVPWCSAFASFVAWLLRLPRSKSLAAKSWLGVGRPITLEEAKPENDVVILTREGGGHVGFFGRYDAATKQVWILGGNQNDQVSLAPFPVDRVVGVRRLDV